ncbi:MAG: hypothetical protein M3Q81_03650 [bacterium]|nr:hypothetical protein [bacterium]
MQYERVTNKRWFQIGVVVVAIALVVAAILRALTPVTPEIPQTPLAVTNLDNTRTSFNNVTFVGTPLTPPARMSVARVLPNQQSVEEVTNRLITSFNLQPVAGAPNTWTSDEYFLSFVPEVGQYEFGRQTLDISGISPIITKPQGMAVAQNFIAATFPNIQLGPIDAGVEYLGAQIHPESVPAEEAHFISVPFSFSVDGYPVYYLNSTIFPFIVVADTNGVQKVRYQPLMSNLETAWQAETLSLAEAMANINANQAAIIFADQEEVLQTNIRSITSGQLESVVLEYRVDANAGLAYPYYRFTGTLLNADGVAIDVVVITPAVKTVPATNQ